MPVKNRRTRIGGTGSSRYILCGFSFGIWLKEKIEHAGRNCRGEGM